MKNPLLDFLKMDEELNERLRNRWALIEGFLKALKELLIKVEKLAWKTLSLNALECPFERSCFSLSQSLVYIVDSLSLSSILWISFSFSLVYLVDHCLSRVDFWILSLSFTFWNLL